MSINCNCCTPECSCDERPVLNLTKPLSFAFEDTAKKYDLAITDLEVPGKYPILGYALNKRGVSKPIVLLFDRWGRAFQPWQNYPYAMFDLCNTRVKHTYWTNIYRLSRGYAPGRLYDTEAEALERKNLANAVATIKVEWEE